MLAMTLVDIDLKMPLKDFETEFQQCIDNWPQKMNYNIKTASTKYGRTMYKVDIDNGDGSTMNLVAEQDEVNGDLYLHPFKLSNMNESYYQFSYADDDIIGTNEDPTMFVCYALGRIAINKKGKFACISANGTPTIIKDGIEKNHTSIALVDDNGNVYSSITAKTISGEESGVDFHVNKPINEWLGEHTDVMQAIGALPLDQKMNYIGKYLINARVKDEIESSEFMDIFCQAGIFGFSDPSVLKIYKLIM